MTAVSSHLPQMQSLSHWHRSFLRLRYEPFHPPCEKQDQGCRQEYSRWNHHKQVQRLWQIGHPSANPLHGSVFLGDAYDGCCLQAMPNSTDVAWLHLRNSVTFHTCRSRWATREFERNKWAIPLPLRTRLVECRSDPPFRSLPRNRAILGWSAHA